MLQYFDVLQSWQHISDCSNKRDFHHATFVVDNTYLNGWCKAEMKCAIKNRKCKDSNCKTVEALTLGKMLIVFCAGSLEWLESTCMHGLDEQVMVLQNYACGWLAQKQMLQDCSTSCAKTRIAGYSRLI
jgi:hypothetical protein